MKELKEIIKILLDKETQFPDWIKYIFIFLAGLTALHISLKLIYGIIQFFQKIWQKAKPLFYNQEKKELNRQRQLFANHILLEITRLNNLEDWSDFRFTELEAEVEAEGEVRRFSLFPSFFSNTSGLRREKSLSKALGHSKERLILLEGEPGSGKSVALRHIAKKLTKSVSSSSNNESLIPLYINLKELERENNEVVDGEFIRSFIWKSLNRINNRDVERFVEQQFDTGLKNGSWLFLFDSFDEIPEILSATDASDTIRMYADALRDFMHGFNQCRGIIASRQFRGPKHLSWSRFRILQLSEKRRKILIQKTLLSKEQKESLVGNLGIATNNIQSMLGNPLLLGLLCEHIESGKPFPENTHIIFESYIDSRFTRDEESLWKRFQIKPKELRKIAERIAFAMLASDSGLSPTRQKIFNSFKEAAFPYEPQLNTYLNALEFIKIARSEGNKISGEKEKNFSFAHRRFQEYFATCVLLQEPEKISPEQLISNARWRETCVVLCQLQTREKQNSLLDEFDKQLEKIVETTPDIIKDPLNYIKEADENTEETKREKKYFTWSNKALHILRILQDGFATKADELSESIQKNASCLLLTVNEYGILPHRKWGLEVAGAAPEPVLLYLLRQAFQDNSQWIKNTAYLQAARLNEPPEDIQLFIRLALGKLFISGRLREEKYVTKAHLSRFVDSKNLLKILFCFSVNRTFRCVKLRWINRLCTTFSLNKTISRTI